MHVYTSVSCIVSSFLQCATHVNLGWRIRVVDSVEEYVANTDWPDTSTCPDLPSATNATTGDSDTSTCPDLSATITDTTATLSPSATITETTPTLSPSATVTVTVTEFMPGI